MPPVHSQHFVSIMSARNNGESERYSLPFLALTAETQIARFTIRGLAFIQFCFSKLVTTPFKAAFNNASKPLC